MDVTNAKSARQLAQAWSQEGPRGARMLRKAREAAEGEEVFRRLA